jgi:hypothetical protein
MKLEICPILKLGAPTIITPKPGMKQRADEHSSIFGLPWLFGTA